MTVWQAGAHKILMQALRIRLGARRIEFDQDFAGFYALPVGDVD